MPEPKETTVGTKELNRVSIKEFVKDGKTEFAILLREEAEVKPWRVVIISEEVYLNLKTAIIKHR